ncbi:hypothetical protein QR680_004467 [Steinernema hermaphroditum]|uniref:Uncharacterized protein n=1 Tax=Steinernema hermaphroditum TaxID=289476 RepID=A0AA39LT81_9BILA|nr:hypothetical protein QR680_004467 [Steinernema hermaphroditum]
MSSKQETTKFNRRSSSKAWIFQKANGSIIEIQPSDEPPKNGPFVPSDAYRKRNITRRITKKASPVGTSPVGVSPTARSPVGQVALKRRASDDRESTAEKRIRREQDKDNTYLVDLIKRLSQKKEEKKTDVVDVSGILALCRANIPTAAKESFPTVEERPFQGYVASWATPEEIAKLAPSAPKVPIVIRQ